MNKSTITREQITAWMNDANYALEEPLNADDAAAARAILAMGDELLAAMDSEPVGNEFIPKNLEKALGVVGMALPESKEEFNFQTERWIQRLIDRVIRYADEFQEQPAPVVPDAATAIRACLSEFPESARDIVEECADIAENACRAAMLQAGDAVRDLSTPVDPQVAEYEQNVMRADNSPVIPDGYVMVPKEPTAEMQSAGASAIRIETTALNKLWTGNAVFRAMLAAAPQEVKGE